MFHFCYIMWLFFSHKVAGSRQISSIKVPFQITEGFISIELVRIKKKKITLWEAEMQP